MIILFMRPLYLILSLLLIFSSISKSDEKFSTWLENYKKYAINQGVSKKTVNEAFKNTKLLKRIITYDRNQPEFIEKTDVYVAKRVNKQKVIYAKKLINNNKKLLDKVEKKYKIPKNYLVALWGVETVFGKHKGKVDIISALATLSFDKRRSKYFSNELIILLKLIDRQVVNISDLKGSWAGAHGNFQFMPSSIKNYAIDYNRDGKIDLYTSLEDSFASAANYLKKIGWDKNPWGLKVKLTKEINKKHFTFDARKLSDSKKIKDWIKMGVVLPDSYKINLNTKAKLVKPDGEISDVYMVFNNYEKILNWNRSLRFAITIGIFSDYLKDA
ncbi:lytic murein transglycosylase [Candidatus Pelagibacter sp. HIMB109]|uniref:lytic murein transglycosylase n=1 Tax=Candidatus Pelagibacter sp. HIMB109 TaxID=3415412 RepID=UPI003F834C03